MPEAEVTAESEAAATIWEVNLAEVGDSHGAAGSESYPSHTSQEKPTNEPGF
jgi:hypothetical protein